jgi:hypothetical protein
MTPNNSDQEQMETNIDKIKDNLRNPSSFSRSPEYRTPVLDYRTVEFVTDKGENRFRIEDGKGIVLDDCRSWGYKSAEKAQNAFDYRCRNNPSYQDLRKRGNSSSRATDREPLTPELISRKVRSFYQSFAVDDITKLTPAQREEFRWAMDEVRKLRAPIER